MVGQVAMYFVLDFYLTAIMVCDEFSLWYQPGNQKTLFEQSV